MIGSFSWVNIPFPFWFSSAAWYCSLVLAMIGLVLAAQQTTVLEIVATNEQSLDQGRASQEARRMLPLLLIKSESKTQRAQHARQPLPLDLRTIGEDVSWRPSWGMVFMWQCPMMFTSYSLCLYLLGLTLYICSPLITGDWGPDTNVST